MKQILKYRDIKKDFHNSSELYSLDKCVYIELYSLITHNLFIDFINDLFFEFSELRRPTL